MITYCRLCEYPSMALGLCEAHYARKRRGMPVHVEIGRRSTTPESAEARLVRRNRKATEREHARRRAHGRAA